MHLINIRDDLKYLWPVKDGKQCVRLFNFNCFFQCNLIIAECETDGNCKTIHPQGQSPVGK